MIFNWEIRLALAREISGLLMSLMEFLDGVVLSVFRSLFPLFELRQVFFAFSIERARPENARGESEGTEGRLGIPREDEYARPKQRNKVKLCSSLTRMKREGRGDQVRKDLANGKSEEIGMPNKTKTLDTKSERRRPGSGCR